MKGNWPRTYWVCHNTWLTVDKDWSLKFKHNIYYVRNSEGKTLSTSPTMNEALQFVRDFKAEQAERIKL